MTVTQTRRSFPAPPTTARALLLRAHPLTDSFNSALGTAWAAGARAAGADVRVIDVHALRFSPALVTAHRDDLPLEPDLVELRQELADAACVAVSTPVWWGSTPALLKGVFDRVLLPGWAYAMGDGPLPLKGLHGREGRLLLTMDAPSWYDRLMYGASARRQLQTATFRFVGIQPTRATTFAAIEHSTSSSREAMLKKAEGQGRQDGRRLVRRFSAVAKGNNADAERPK